MSNEDLIERARVYWETGSFIPMDLAVQMMEAGLDVNALESKYLNN